MKNKEKLIRTIIVCVSLFFFLSPLLILVNSSLSTYNNLITWPPKWFQDIQWSNYTEVLFGEKSIVRPFLNTLHISIVTMILCVFIGLLAGYAVTRFEFVGKKIFMMVILMTQMFSAVILVNPMYIIFRDAGLLDTKLSLILSTTTTSLPMTVWLLHSYFSQIPLDYEEASWMDGASRIQGIFQIILPLALPGIITSGLFAFLASWGNLIFVKTFITSQELRMISQALMDFKELYKTTYETQMAASVLATIPPFLIFLFIQKYLVKAMLAQGVKN